MVSTVVIGAAALLVASAILPGFTVDGAGAAIAAVLVSGAINALLWPLLIRIALPLTVATIGLGALVLNALVLLGTAAIVPGVDLAGVFDGVLAVVLVTAITSLGTGLVSINDEARFRGHLARRPKPKNPITTDIPGLLMLEIDGLAHEVLQRALRDGNVPALAAWIHDGSHQLVRWETDWSSQTGACQAGILHGNNHDMPAFRWWEKDTGRAIVTNHPRDAAEIEARISDGKGLLHDDGASRANILSGDAPHSLLTMSTVLDVRRDRLGRDYFTYFSDPYNMVRTLCLAVADMLVERREAGRQRRRDVRPRIARNWSYASVRAFATAVQLDLQVETVIGDLEAGRPTIYTTFLAYDEVAHHSGLERRDTLAVLSRVDQRIARIAAAAARAPRPYEVVVLSDHGQSQGATFLQRHGMTLEDVVREACGADAVAAATDAEDETRGRLGAGLAEVAASVGPDGARGKALARAERAVVAEDPLPAAPATDADAVAPQPPPEVVVMASGNLGLISFPRRPGRVTREAIDDAYPQLLDRLRSHPGIGFVLVRDESGEDVVLGADGEHRISEGRVIGADPLAPFGPRAPLHVARTAHFPHCPDLVVNGAYDPQLGEVGAFEELVGSHGGLGGAQSFPFLMAPASLPLPEGDIVGAEAVHRLLRSWLAQLGHTAFADTPAIVP
ncbi:phage holin family protein [Baekduia sp. Peel2402]|uniref:phage holin family protein n=1 Tax=Baekduia sp. Peel2402 TaxID=3458296 RepID=UPI00403E6554